MKIQEAQQFYRKQFDLYGKHIDYPELDEGLAADIVEQMGRPFTSVLELGAGKGNLARCLAGCGKSVTTVELVPELVEYAEQFQSPDVTSICGSFYDIELPRQFDAVLYMDGFGVGTDAEQLQLLRRIHNWLCDDGAALIDIYEPTYWKQTSGRTMTLPGDVSRVYGYDDSRNRMTDTWWPTDRPDEKMTQSLACYSLDDIHKLCKQARLQIVAYFPGGTMDFDTWTYHEVASLAQCISYRIKVMKMR